MNRPLALLIALVGCASLPAACSQEKRSFNGAGGGTAASGAGGSVETGQGGGGAGAGGAAGCEAGEARPCYSGPPGTEGVGPCKAGVAVCAEDGSGFGACTDEVMPAQEECATPVDQNCRPDCGELQWLKRFGDTGDDFGAEIAADPQGNVFVAGFFTGRLDLGGDTLTANAAIDEYDTFLARFDPAGAHVWSRQLNPASQSYVTSVVPTADGGLLVGGEFAGELDLGGGPLSRSGTGVAFLAKLDAAGAHVWSRSFPGSATSSINGVAVDSAGNIVAVGRFTGTLQPIIGSGLTSNGGADLLAVKLTAAGVPSWSTSFGGPGDDVAVRVAVDREGSAFMTGLFNNTMRAGSISVTSAGQQDAFLLVLDSLAGVKWCRRGGGPSYDSAQDVAVDGDGNAYVVGTFDSGADLAGVALANAGRTDVFLARFDGRGNLVWNKTFGAPLLDTANQVIVDAKGTVWMTGNFAGTVNFGGQPLIATGAQSPFLARFDALGAHLFSTTGLSQGFAIDAAGAILETGGFTGTLSVRGQDLVSAGGEDIFLAKLATPELVTGP